MAIKAAFPEGTTSITLAPLYQWDYGQQLEIEAASLPSLIEVHFACQGMNEAVVHTCSCVNNIATVAIPDQCLEQSNDITAWVYEIDGTAGRTIYSIHIPITARTRPARSESIPQSVQDTYTQLITEVNDLLESLQNGTINVGYAIKADSADKAISADSATTAISANTAGSATSAVNDGNGNKISDTYIKIPSGYANMPDTPRFARGLYIFRVFMLGDGYAEMHTQLIQTGGTIAAYVYSDMFSFNDQFYRLKFINGNTDGATYSGLQVWSEQDGSWRDAASTVTAYVYYKQLMD